MEWKTRKRIIYLSVIICVFLVLFSVYLYFSDKEAKRLYNDAATFIQTAVQIESDDYTLSHEYYQKAINNLKTISEKYPFSILAIKISNNDISIEGFSIKELNENILPNFELKASGENDPFMLALLIANSINEKNSLFKSREKIAGYIPVACILAGKIEESEKIFGMITFQDESTKAETIGKMSAAFIEQNEYQNGLRLAQTINFQYYREKALYDIANKYTEDEKFGKALEATENITDPYWYGSSLGNIARNCVTVYEKNAAINLLDDLYNRASAVKWGMNYWGALPLIKISAAYAQVGELQKAYQIINQVYAITKNIDESVYESYRWEFIDELANAFARNKNYSEAIKTLNLITNKDWMNKTLSDLVATCLDIKDPDEAIKLIRTIENKDLSEQLLSNIALFYAENLETNKASEIEKQVKNENFKALIIQKMAEAFIKTGKPDYSKNILQTYLKSVDENKSLKVGQRNMILAISAETFAETKNFNDALETSKLISDPTMKEKILSGISSYLSYDGQFDKAVEIIDTIKREDFKINALLELGIAYQQFGAEPSAQVKAIFHKIIIGLNI
jgi:hypothetical protein